MKKVIVQFGNKDLVGKIVYSNGSMNGKYRFLGFTPFRIKYVGESHIVMQGLNPEVSLGEYIFDDCDVRQLDFFYIDFDGE